MHIVHWHYGQIRGNNVTLVRCPNGEGKTFMDPGELKEFLRDKKWRWAK